MKGMITFVTGNKGKWKEVAGILGDSAVQAVQTIQIAQKDIDLPEIQDLDVKKVIAAKLLEARKIITEGAILVDDSGYYFHELGRLPGVFTKFFFEELGLPRSAEMLAKLGDTAITAYTVLGFMDEDNRVTYFEGSVEGTMVPPRGEGGFGFDPVFLPIGSKKTVAEMTDEERRQFKMRAIAVRKLGEFLGRKG